MKKTKFKIAEIALMEILFILLSFLIEDVLHLSYIYLVLLILDYFVQKVIEKKYK